MQPGGIYWPRPWLRVICIKPSRWVVDCEACGAVYGSGYNHRHQPRSRKGVARAIKMHRRCGDINRLAKP